jgi:hypothetical protein
MERAAWFPDCQHLASTFTATTLATLATGAWPAQHGIVADAWYERETKNRIPASDEALRAGTLAAQINADLRSSSDEPKSRLYVVADRISDARLFAAGSPAKLFWMDEAGQFAAQGEVPGWLAAWSSNNPPEQLRGKKWDLLGAKSDAPPMRILEYDAAKPAGFTALLKSSPFAQSAQFDVLAECIEGERLGLGDTTDVALALIGAGERLGYETGLRSPLMSQLLLHLDHKLDELIGRLIKHAGESGFTLVVAGAHGAPPLPSPDARARMEVDGESVAQIVDKGLRFAGVGSVVRYLYPFLHLDTGGAYDPETVRKTAAELARTHPAVAGTLTAGGQCSTLNQWRQRFENSFHSQRSGDLMISYRPGYVEKFGDGRGVSYGSLYDYETRTPLFLYGPQFKPGSYEDPVYSVDIAPTLARALGVGAPPSSMGRVLGEAFGE